MNRYPTSLLRLGVALLILLGMSSCAEMQRQPAKVAAGPAPKFTIAAAGLPDSGIWKCTPVLTDINRDGHLDILAIPRLGDGAHVFLGDGRGNWRDASQGLTRSSSCGGGTAYGDINRDGLLDLVVGDHCSGVYVFLQQPDGSWKAVVEGLNPPVSKNVVRDDDDDSRKFFSGAEDIALGDINEDGCLDIVAPASDQGGFSVYLGDCTGRKWKSMTGTGLPNMDQPEPNDEDNAGWANRVILADLNKDGHLDVLASYFKGPRAWLGDGKGHFQNTSTGLPEPPFGGLYRGLDFGDLNGDGLLDMVGANDINGPEAYLQQPDGTWQQIPDLMPSMQNGAVGIALGDFRKSGQLDIVVAGRKEKARGNNYGLYYLQGDGKGNFQELTNTDLPAKGLSVAWGVAVGDVNEDGLPDFVASTGGSVTGAKDPKVQKLSKSKTAKEPQEDVIPELPLPRMQAWINQGVK